MKNRAIVLVTQPSDARRRVAGMSLLERVVRTASADGSEVIVTGHDAGVLSALSPNVQVHFGSPETLAASLASVDGPVTLWLAHHVYDRRAGSLLRQYAVQLETASLGSAALLLTRARVASGVLSAPDQEAALLAAVAGAPHLQISEPAAAISVDASSDAGASAATEALWQSCRKPIDGYVSRHLNRYISLAISRRIVDTAITPNHVSVLCIVLGVIAGVIAAHGGYVYLLAGATLFQLNSILDGVDGELARVRWAHSKVGELLDSAGDNVANFSYFGGVTVAAYRMGQTNLATVGAVALTLWALYLVFLYSRLSGSGSGDVMTVRTSLEKLPLPIVHVLIALGRKVLRRDMFVMVSFLAAVLGYAPNMLVIVLVGASIVFAYAVLHFAARLVKPVETLKVDSQ
jgi:phosphatidylglycerophosphate synthase